MPIGATDAGKKDKTEYNIRVVAVSLITSLNRPKFRLVASGSGVVCAVLGLMIDHANIYFSTRPIEVYLSGVLSN